MKPVVIVAGAEPMADAAGRFHADKRRLEEGLTAASCRSAIASAAGKIATLGCPT